MECYGCGGACSRGRLLGRKVWIERAEELGNLALRSRSAPRSSASHLGAHSPPGVLEDHAFLAEALLDLYEATGTPKWLLNCVDLLDSALPHFEAPRNQGFYRSANTKLLVRQRSLRTEPSPRDFPVWGNAWLRLQAYGHRLGDHPGLKGILHLGAGLLKTRPGSVPELVIAWDRFNHWSTEVVVAAPDPKSALGFQQAYNARVRPDCVLGVLTPERAEALGDFALFQNRECPKEGARAYVCANQSCKLPIFFNPAELEEELTGVQGV